MAGKGSPPGVRLGGRQKGSLNHATLARQSAVLASGLSPLDYLCGVFRDESEPTSIRVDAAKAVCAYVYPKLQALDVNATGGQPLNVTIVKFSELPGEEQATEYDPLMRSRQLPASNEG